MGDCGIINPTRTPEKGRAVEFILDTVNKYPNEVELVVLGPATNIALAIMTDREVMKKVKHIWSMGTPGFGEGNATPVSEFNVFIDAEAYAVMLDCGVPVTIAGFDICLGSAEIDKAALIAYANGNKVGRFLERATSKLLEFNFDSRGEYLIALPDAIAMAAALWDGFIKDSVNCYCKCCTQYGETYGQVILYSDGKTYEAVPNSPKANARIITEIDADLFASNLLNLLKQ